VGQQDDFLNDLPSRVKVGRWRRPKFIAVDFFCGAGGTTRGLIDANGYVIAGIDKQSSCMRTYVANNGNETLDRAYPTYLDMDIFPKVKDYPGGQQKRIFDKLDVLISETRALAPQAPLLFAICAPCQPFTKLSRATMSDDRVEARLRDRGLLAHACRFVKKYMPDIVLSENVAAVTDARYGGVWEDFAKRLDKMGYEVATTVACTSKFGVPQYRKRSILAAFKRRDESLRTEPLELPAEDVKAKMVTVARALAGLPKLGPGERHPVIANHATRNLSDLNRRRISYSQPGESNAYLESTPEGNLSLGCHQRVNRKLNVRCFGDVYTRMAPDRPSPTITTRCHSITNGRFGHHDTEQLRGISMREAARLQSFEDDYVFYPEHQIEPVARMIGNAVPPKLAEFYARYLVDRYDVSEAF